MNDQQLGRATGQWLRDIDSPPSDPQADVQPAMEQVRVTQQVRRSRLHFEFRRTTQTETDEPTRTDTTHYQPSPIPATNGHTPTAIWRTTSMLSPVKAITAGAIVFAIGGAFLIALPFGQEASVPGAEQDQAAPHPPEPFSAIVACGGQIAFGSSERLEYPMDEATMTIVARRGDAWGPTVREVNDPRFEGRYSISYDTDSYFAAGLTAQEVVGAGTWRIENDEGAWQGSYHIMDPLDGGDVTVTVPLAGEGAFEGLTAMVESAYDSGACVWQWRGLVVDGDLPAYPEPPAE